MRSIALVYLILNCLAFPVSSAPVPPDSTDRDPYGGWKNLSFEATGFFAVRERDGIWWLATPQGHAFLSKSVNHVSFRADDAPTLGYSPYQRAVQKKYGSEQAWAASVVKRLRGWGFNTLGSWSSPSTFTQNMPYTVNLNLATQADRAEGFTRYVHGLIDLPFMVGFHWFEHADQPKEGRFDGENSNYGLVTIDDRPWDTLVQRMTEVNARLEARRLQAVGAGREGNENADRADAIIRRLIKAVDREQISKHVFYLAKDPLPYRKLNLTLPGHEKSTLHEADDYLADKLEAWGYDVEREPVQVQAFRRDTSKPKHAQYSPPKPEDPWYTAYNLYAEKKGRSRPDQIILVLAHKDSQSWVDSPGANDNAIGTAGVLEMARILAGYPSESTIRFLFCNEEHTPWTSRTAAQKAKARGDDIIAVFNLDGIGAKTAEETAAGKKTNVTAYTKPEGKRLADLMGEVNTRYAIGLEHRTAERSGPGDDDGSFVLAGYPAAVINIGSWPYGDPNYHAEGDVPESCDMENAAMTVQATLAAVVTLDLTAAGQASQP